MGQITNLMWANTHRGFESYRFRQKNTEDKMNTTDLNLLAQVVKEAKEQMLRERVPVYTYKSFDGKYFSTTESPAVKPAEWAVLIGEIRPRT